MDLVKLTQESRVARAFQEDVSKRFESDINVLDHYYFSKRTDSNGKAVPLDEVYWLVDKSHDKVSAWYSSEAGEPLQKGRPPKTELSGELRNKFYEQPDFRQAVDVLFGNGSFDNLKKMNALPKTPWHNEITTGEIRSFYRDETGKDSRYFVDLVPAHSLELQINREGFAMPIKPISTDGIILASPDEASEMGYVVFGVRGGGSYPNTYHTVAAGVLSVSDALKRGEESIQEAFIRRELIPELGDDLTKAQSVSPIGRVEDWLLGMGNCTYVFEVKTNLSKQGIIDSWVTAKDGKEHSELIFIPNSPKHLKDFIKQNYKGVVANKTDRTDQKRFLLHPGALDLSVYAGINPKEIREFYREGEW